MLFQGFLEHFPGRQADLRRAAIGAGAEEDVPAIIANTELGGRGFQLFSLLIHRITACMISPWQEVNAACLGGRGWSLRKPRLSLPGLPKTPAAATPTGHCFPGDHNLTCPRELRGRASRECLLWARAFCRSPASGIFPLSSLDSSARPFRSSPGKSRSAFPLSRRHKPFRLCRRPACSAPSL